MTKKTSARYSPEVRVRAVRMVLLIFGAAVSACVYVPPVTLLAMILPASAAEKVVLQLSWDHQFQFAGYYAAQWQGYYAEAGFDVELRSRIRPDGTFYNVVREVEEGRAAFGIGGGNILVAKDKDAPLMLLAPVFQQSAVALYAKKGARLNSPADLTRLTVAAGIGGLARAEISAMLRAENIDPANVEFVETKGGILDLATGQAEVVIGYVIEAEWLAKELGLTLTSLRPATYGVDFYGDSLFTHRDRVIDDPEGVSRFIAATLKGWEYALTHPEEIADRITSDFSRHFAVRDLKGFNRNAIGPVRRLTLVPVVQLGHINPDRWRKMYELLKQSKAIKGPFDPTDLIFNPKLQERQRQERIVRLILYGLVALSLIAVFAWVLLLLKHREERKRAEEAIKRERDRTVEFLEIAEALIVALDPAGTVTLINRRGCEILGYAEDEIVGRNWFETFIPEDQRERVLAGFVKIVAGEIEPVEYFENDVLTKGGERRFIAWHNTLVRDDGGTITGSLSSGQDITERKLAEEKIEASLAEKEVLLREIHHRVKNNLQVVSSMLSLQAGTETGNRSIGALEEAQRRVKVMARIYENLHQSDDLASINARDYLNTVVADTMASSGTDAEDISFRLDADDIILHVDHAVACGQIISELLSNALKHAFPNGRSGNVEVSLRRRNQGTVELTVADDGKGLPEDFDLEQTETLGMRLVHALAMQLSGSVSVDGSGGTRVQIAFQEKPP